MPLTRSRRWRRECGAEGAESRARIAAAGEERGSSGPEASAAAVALPLHRRANYTAAQRAAVQTAATATNS